MENLVYWKAFEWDVLENKYGRSELEREEFKSILEWAEEVKIALNESLNEEIFEENKSSSTLDDIDCLEGHMDLSLGENGLVYDEKECTDFMFIVDQDVKVNIKGYFKFDDCNKCESLRKDLAYERDRKDQFEGIYTPLDVKGNVLVNVNSKLEVLEKEQLKFEVKLKEEFSFLDEDLRKGSSSVLVKGKEKKASERGKGKQDGIVEEMSNNFVRLENENSSMALCLRNRAMRMEVMH